MIIDGEGAVLGRLASTAAKRLLCGEEVVIVNAEKAVISGKPSMVRKRYLFKRQLGDALHGPFFPRYSDRIVWRTVRGMLPYKQPKGREALRRLKVYIGCPEEFKNAEKMAKPLRCKSMTVKELSRYLGAKVD